MKQELVSFNGLARGTTNTNFLQTINTEFANDAYLFITNITTSVVF